MGIDVNLANSQGYKIDSYISNLREVKNSLNNYKSSLNNFWQGEEIVFINNAIEIINQDINKLSYFLEELKQDIRITAKEIKCEEELQLLNK